MEVGTFIFWGAVVVVLMYGVTLYNNLVTLKHNVDQAWANIDVLLKQRHDELPKLVETCKAYMKHERGTLDDVMKARASVFKAREAGDVSGVGRAEGALRMGLGTLFAVAENYPDLKANESFQHVQSRITGLENGIADRRELYNESVNLNNIRIEQFPDVVVARMFAFKERDLLEFSEAEKADVDMKGLFDS
jgi:LemA protein